MNEEQLKQINEVREKALKARIDGDFASHVVTEEGQRRMAFVRDQAKCLAITITQITPMNRSQSTALTKLEEVMFHANAAIAREFPMVPAAREATS